MHGKGTWSESLFSRKSDYGHWATMNPSIQEALVSAGRSDKKDQLKLAGRLITNIHGRAKVNTEIFLIHK